MPKYRIEVEERRTITRETWIEATDASEANEVAAFQDWRTWDEVGTDTDSRITLIEDADTGATFAPE